MAAELPMKEKRVAGTVRMFDMRMATVAQRLFLGGALSFSIKLETSDDTSEERWRLHGICSSSSCALEEALRFTLRVKDGVSYPFGASAGERARVGLVGSRIRCSDL